MDRHTIDRLITDITNLLYQCYNYPTISGARDRAGHIMQPIALDEPVDFATILSSLIPTKVVVGIYERRSRAAAAIEIQRMIEEEI